MARTNIFIAFVLLLLCYTPGLAETLRGQVSKSTVGDSVIDETRMGGTEQSSLNNEFPDVDKAQTQIELQAPRLSGEANHGELGVGVLGCQFLINLFNVRSATIVKIFPGSDLLRLGIRPGDRIVGVNGHRVFGRQLSEECRGTPGTTVDLLFERHGQEIEVKAIRKDAREFAQYEHYFRKWAAQTKTW